MSNADNQKSNNVSGFELKGDYEPIDFSRRKYEKTAFFILIKAVHDLFPDIKLSDIAVRFKMKNELYIEIQSLEICDNTVEAIKDRMTEIIEDDFPIRKKKVGKEAAVRQFRKLGMTDKAELLHYRRTEQVDIYVLDDIIDYFYDEVAPSTGYISSFYLIRYDTGMVLITPDTAASEMKCLTFGKKLFQSLYSQLKVMTSAGILNNSDFNRKISEDGFVSPVLIQEAFMEKEISEIARRISSNKRIKIVLIAGPSSSGKTTFSHRLSVQLVANGKNARPVATDNYYLDRDRVPYDENGKPDFEALESIDVDLFSRDCNLLLSGEMVEIPVYNFKTGKREYRGDQLKLEENDILLLEGIHCLDPGMIGDLPEECIFKIYIAPLVQLGIDSHNYINADDARLIRRIVRDNRSRAFSASSTIAQWYSVRRGEEKYIYPYIDKADIVFNSSILYELSALKPYAEALLFSIKPEDQAYEAAEYLLRILDYYLAVPVDIVPENSLLSEFIGGNIYGV